MAEGMQKAMVTLGQKNRIILSGRVIVNIDNELGNFQFSYSLFGGSPLFEVRMRTVK